MGALNSWNTNLGLRNLLFGDAFIKMEFVLCLFIDLSQLMGAACWRWTRWVQSPTPCPALTWGLILWPPCPLASGRVRLGEMQAGELRAGGRGELCAPHLRAPRLWATVPSMCPPASSNSTFSPALPPRRVRVPGPAHLCALGPSASSRSPRLALGGSAGP